MRISENFLGEWTTLMSASHPDPVVWTCEGRGGGLEFFGAK